MKNILIKGLAIMLAAAVTAGANYTLTYFNQPDAAWLYNLLVEAIL